MMFKHAIVRPPSSNFAEGLTTAGLGAPDYELALRQHAAYCQALEGCGLELIRLPTDPRFPDSTFVEDTAILGGDLAVLTLPGAPSRQGEVDSIRETLAPFFPEIHPIEPPGTVEGGDICEAEGHFFIGISQRTNQAGAQQLASFLSLAGYTSSTVDIWGIPGLLHLKSGIASLGDNRLALIDGLAGRDEFQGYEIVHVDPAEAYAANCVRVNDAVLVAAGFPGFASSLRSLGYQLIELEVSEFQKMDGGLSCLSLRW